MTEISKRSEKYKSWSKINTFVFAYNENKSNQLIVESWDYNFDNNNQNDNFLGLG